MKSPTILHRSLMFQSLICISSHFGDTLQCVLIHIGYTSFLTTRNSLRKARCIHIAKMRSDERLIEHTKADIGGRRWNHRSAIGFFFQVIDKQI